MMVVSISFDNFFGRIVFLVAICVGSSENFEGNCRKGGKIKQSCCNIATRDGSNRSSNGNLIWANAKSVVRPGFSYFKKHFVEMTEGSNARQFQKACELFSFAQLFHPVYARQLVEDNGFSLDAILRRPTTKGVLEVLGPSIISDLKNDFSAFVETLERNITPGVKYRPPQVLEWWKTHGSKVGAWAAAARLFTLLQPSEASVERLFAVMRNAVDESQESMLEDQVELRVRTKFKMKIDAEQ
jgi:hypothetical protein